MVHLFGHHLSRADLARLLPDLSQLAGFRHFTVDDGPGRGMRVLQIDSGGGLRIDLLPDRACDIGQVWCNDLPFCWINPMGTPAPKVVGANTSLSGLMSTCGFDHIRQPETDEGRRYPLHGGMMHAPARILSTEILWRGDECTFCVRAEATQFVLDRGTIRLERQIEVPLGGTSLRLCDEVRMLSGRMPIMAMYHINLGFPLVTPESTVVLGGQDITPDCMAESDIRVRSSIAGTTEVRLAGGKSPQGPTFTVRYDGNALPYLQTLRNGADGINLFCIEPATHDRVSRAELRKRGALTAAESGGASTFRLELNFDCGSGKTVRDAA